MSAEWPFSAGFQAALPKALLAIWFAIILFHGCDWRKQSGLSRLALAAASLLAGWGWLGQEPVGSVRWAVWSSVVASFVLAASGLRAGLTSWRNMVVLLCLLGGAAAAWGLLAEALSQRQLPWLSKTAAGMHLIGLCGLWGTAIFSALELTFLSTPQQLASDRQPITRWTPVAAMAMILLSLELAAVLLLFASPSDMVPAADWQLHLLSRAYGLTALVLGLIAWMIASRVARFQRRGGPVGWASLAVAAWIAVLSFAVAAFLPHHWPWSEL